MTGLLVALGAVAIATALGLLHRVRQGRISRRPQTATPAPEVGGTARPGPGGELPEPVRAAVFDGTSPEQADSVVLLQLSTTFCAPCRHAKVVLADLAERTQGLRHVEFDLTPVPEVAADLHVLRTPTTLALDAEGRELFRVHGVPKRDRLAAELAPHLGVPPGRPRRR